MFLSETEDNKQCAANGEARCYLAQSKTRACGDVL